MIGVGNSVLLAAGHPWSGFAGTVIARGRGLYMVALGEGLVVGAEPGEIVCA